jgi:hypothetical protein
VPRLGGPAIRSGCHGNATFPAVSGGTFTRIGFLESYSHSVRRSPSQRRPSPGTASRRPDRSNTLAVWPVRWHGPTCGRRSSIDSRRLGTGRSPFVRFELGIRASPYGPPFLSLSRSDGSQSGERWHGDEGHARSKHEYPLAWPFAMRRRRSSCGNRGLAFTERNWTRTGSANAVRGSLVLGLSLGL